MKVVYSPNTMFSQQKSLFRFMDNNFQLSHDQLMSLERHDPRLVEATVECRKRSGGMSSLVPQELICHSQMNKLSF